MGCVASSTADVVLENNPIFLEPKHGNEKGFHAKTASLDTASWILNMKAYVRSHVKQTEDYNNADVEIMFDKYNRFLRGAGTHNRTLDDPIHRNAVDELRNVFEVNTEYTTLEARMSALITAYGRSGRREEFEEIALLFSIILNAPIIRRCEIPW